MVVYISNASFIFHTVTIVLVSMAAGGASMYWIMKRLSESTQKNKGFRESKNKQG